MYGIASPRLLSLMYVSTAWLTSLLNSVAVMGAGAVVASCLSRLYMSVVVKALEYRLVISCHSRSDFISSSSVSDTSLTAFILFMLSLMFVAMSFHLRWFVEVH